MAKPIQVDAPFKGLHDLLSAEEDARACRDISDDACREQPRNYGVHLVALSLTKIGDGLVDAKLILSWLLDALGAPLAAIAALVPVRESLSLVPQLAVAGWMRAYALRKWFWVGGSVAQGASLLAMALVAWSFDGAVAGWTIVALLAVFALARGVCSVAYKDVLGKTIAKQRRGTLNGYTASAAGIAVVALGLALQLEAGTDIDVFASILVLAAALWITGAGVFALLEEYPGATEGGANALREAIGSVRMIFHDRQLALFLASRALLVSTALMAPFFAVIARQIGATDLSDLGLLVIASGLAASASAAIWGRWSDRSSRKVMAAAGGIAASAGIAAAALGSAFARGGAWLAYALGALYFLLAIAHTGVRLGRKTHLVDMAGSDRRASYVAVSNTLIGIVLLLGASVGLLADTLGAAAVVAIFSLLAALGAAMSLALDEVQR
ncbi:MAG: MFS transporter [Gammaproteobacteria bacterium]|nr:MFS transporter [Gammaproteobacteria bacterium]